MRPDPPTVLIVDDDVSFARAISRLLQARGYSVKVFDSAADFLHEATANRAGCAIVDLRMPGPSGLDLQQTLREADCMLPLIFLTGHCDIPASVQAMRYGAEDFLTKPVHKEVLFDAVERALARDTVQREARAKANELQTRYDKLTPRECEVLAHVLQGKLNKQIADDLGTSERTIKAHRAQIKAKLQVQSVAEMARMAQELGIEPGP
jgi:FixJ family two-component response regulator